MSFPPFFYAIQIAKNAAAATAAAIPFAQKQEKESRLSILFFCAITTAQDFILLPPLQQQANNYAGRMGNINSAFFFYSKALLYATEGERRRQFFPLSQTVRRPPRSSPLPLLSQLDDEQGPIFTTRGGDTNVLRLEKELKKIISPVFGKRLYSTTCAKSANVNLVSPSLPPPSSYPFSMSHPMHFKPLFLLSLSGEDLCRREKSLSQT